MERGNENRTGERWTLRRPPVRERGLEMKKIDRE